MRSASSPVTRAGRCNFTSYYYLERDYFDVDEVSALRLDKSALLTRPFRFPCGWLPAHGIWCGDAAFRPGDVGAAGQLGGVRLRLSVVRRKC